MLAIFFTLLSMGPSPRPVPPQTSGDQVGRVYRIPYRLTDTKHILIRARVNGRGPYNFIMDTGAPDLFLAAEKAREAGCPVGEAARIRTFEIEGGPTLENIGARVEELFQLRSMNAIDAVGARIDGVMGYTVLSRFRLEIDLAKDRMNWTRLSYKPSPPPGLRELTGGKVPSAAKDVKGLEDVAKAATSMFARKPSRPPIARGFVGMEIEPEGSPRISALFPGGPAELSGLQPGDLILAVELPPADPVEVKSIAALSKALKEIRPGETFHLIIERDGRKRKATVKAVSSL